MYSGFQDFRKGIQFMEKEKSIIVSSPIKIISMKSKTLLMLILVVIEIMFL
jgi:hypothetical protein